MSILWNRTDLDNVDVGKLEVYPNFNTRIFFFIRINFVDLPKFKNKSV